MMSRPLALALALATLFLLPAIVPAVELPRDHEYQQQLRAYMATLTEADFNIDIKPFTAAPGPRTADDQLRAVMLSYNITYFLSCLRQPSSQFTLQAIEGPDGIMFPPIYSDAASWMALWKYPGNPYQYSRGLKLRAFVTAGVDMIMLDNDHEKLGLGKRSDYLGGTLIWLAYAYNASRDVLPPEVSAAYAEGLKKMVRRLNTWGPTGSMTDMDLFAAVSMRTVADLVNDPEITKIAEAYVKRLYTDPHYYNSAGYFVDNGCFDTSYNGISLYFTIHAALQAPDWPFIRDALDQAYRLKAHLSFPEPDGDAFGPTNMSSRTSGDSPHDQWNFAHRNPGAAMLTDNAMYLLPELPTPEQLAVAEKELIDELNGLLNSRVTPPEEAKKWVERHWSGQNINFSYDFYMNGFYERWAKLKADKSPLLQNPFLRDANFIEDFEKAFLIGKFGDYAFAIHTGPVGGGIFGWGGGELVTFWTKKSGVVMLGRRRGWEPQTRPRPNPDSFDTWRIWPVNAISGITEDGQVFSSARIRDPKPVYTIAPDKSRARVQVAGLIPKDPTNTANPCLRGDVQYGRTFVVDTTGVTITTTIGSDGKDKATELYETIPVFLHNGNPTEKNTAKIAFRVGNAWMEGTPEFQANVTAVKITRFDGAVLVTFAKPQRVKLSPEVWKDYYMSSVNCRTILVDLLGGDGQPRAIPSTSIRYKITAVKE